ncbi:MAG TPA: preprotein translocase subunit SecY, partial [Streptosporangiaceae bacterium]|nr:preprotein translocase subunit SecY [Streptosporangiaceae bacterium]
MLTTFIRAFRARDLRRKLLFTVGVVVVFRFGASVPAPGISERNVIHCTGLASQAGSSSASLVSLLNVLSGSALLHLTVFALGIYPYITASIILQLLAQTVPRLDQLRKEGQAGQAKITQYTRYLTVGLGVIYAAVYIESARSGTLFGSACDTPLIPHPTPLTIGTIMVTMVGGTAVIMWMGELITDRGVGNGMSVLMFTTILVGIPGELEQIYESKGIFYAGTGVVLVLAVVVCVVFIEQSQRRVPVQYAKRMVGRREYAGGSTYIPLKLNQAGVIPLIFAASALTVPQIALTTFGTRSPAWLQRYLLPTGPSPYGYFVVMTVLIVAFSYFYVAVTFNPSDVAENMQKYGGFIPGIRPGRPTAQYLSYVSTRMTAPGAVYLALIALFPLVAL